ncbi:MAG: hypothetical protein IV094_20485 [Vitreoscilla sp.]|nr:hypothetical protein [Vitreoscilla sp.]
MLHFAASGMGRALQNSINVSPHGEARSDKRCRDLRGENHPVFDGEFVPGFVEGAVNAAFSG